MKKYLFSISLYLMVVFFFWLFTGLDYGDCTTGAMVLITLGWFQIASVCTDISNDIFG